MYDFVTHRRPGGCPAWGCRGTAAGAADRAPVTGLRVLPRSCTISEQRGRSTGLPCAGMMLTTLLAPEAASACRMARSIAGLAVALHAVVAVAAGAPLVVGAAAPSAAPPFWEVNATCLAACERFCANSTACQAISFGRNFNHGLQCNFHACANLTSRHDNILWMTYTRDSSSKETTFTQHDWSVTSCVNPQHPPLSDYDCARPGSPPGPPPPPPPPPPPLNNCTAKQLTRPRHASLWLPGVADGRGDDTARYIKVCLCAGTGVCV